MPGGHPQHRSLPTMASSLLANAGAGQKTRSHSFASPSIRRRSALPRAVRFAQCRARGRDDGPGSVDRRDLLLGLGGLYSATLALNREALAVPVTTPDIKSCQDATIPNADKALYDKKCCPPGSQVPIADYVIPAYTSFRERPAAHSMSASQIKDYETAIANSKTRDPKADPWSYIQQAKIHCAYCNGGYDQVGFPDLELQVHSSWLFLPFHRWYLYFYERILGKLCNNEKFALPYWNWDNPPGMTMPQPFINPKSSLYDLNRDQSHLPPVLLDLDNADNENFTPEEQIQHNLWVMYRAMVANAKTASCFHGGKYVGGSKPNPGPGSIETPHNLVHRWTGNPGNPNGEDMGSFYSSGLDPLFYCHHSNVDRMWSLWQDLGGKDFTDPDWLNTSFLFYDENAKLVRVYVRDCIKTEKLGYKFQKMPILWKDKRAQRRRPPGQKPKREPATEATFPVVLKGPVKTTLKVPKKKGPDDDYVIVSKVSLDRTVYAKFDVYVNAENTESLGSVPVEKAGSFVNIPQTARPPPQNILTTYSKLGVGELLEDIGADQDEEVQVTIVPRKGKNQITISSVSLQTNCDVVP